MFKVFNIGKNVEQSKYGRLLAIFFEKNKENPVAAYVDKKTAIYLLEFVEFLNLSIGSDEQEFAANFAAWVGTQDITGDGTLVRWLDLYSVEKHKETLITQKSNNVLTLYTGEELARFVELDEQAAIRAEPLFMKRIILYNSDMFYFWPSFSLWLVNDKSKNVRLSAMGWLKVYILEGRL